MRSQHLAAGSKTLADEGNWQHATEVAAVGARLAPEDRGLASARKAIWQRWAFSEADAGRPEAALAILTRAANEVDADTFDGMRSAVLIRPAEALIKIGDWEEALDLTATAAALLGGDALADLQEWRSGVYERWTYDHMENGQFRDALEILVAGHNAYAGDRDLTRAARYLAQEWAKAEGFPDGLVVFAALNAALPKVSDIGEIAETFVRRHVSDGMVERELEAALADVQTAASYVTPETATSLIAYVYETYGHASIDAKRWELAADIYAAGRAAVPDSKILSRNARYVAQEWQRQASAQGGVAALDEVQRKLRGLFPEFAVDPGFGEDEIVRQINAALRSGDAAVAVETLATAQLLIRPETFRKLQTGITDHQAREAMETGNWAKAARIYHDARLQIGDPKLFSRNIAYIAQEWTRVAAATNGATGIVTVMEELRSLFPDDKKVGGMGVATLERMIAQHIEAGAFDDAEDLVRQARRVFSGEEARELLVALYARAGSKAIDDARWEAALTAYSDGLALAPDARDLSRNVPYVLQEWSRTALEQGGASLLVSEIARMEEILPGTKSLPDVLESVLGRAVSAQLDRADPEGALTLIDDVSIALPDGVTAKLRAVTYDRWAKTKFDAEQWQEAIEIYDMGLLDVPDSRLLQNNRRYAKSKL